MLAKSAFTTLIAAGVLVCSVGCSTSYRTRQGTSDAAHHRNVRVRVVNAKQPGAGKSDESGWAKRFKKLVPPGAVGYPTFGLVVAPLSRSSSVPPGAVGQALAQFKQLRVAKALLGKLLTTQVPRAVLRTVTDYLPSVPGIRKGSSFPAVVITFHRVKCDAFGSSTFTSFTCRTMAVLDLRNGKWLGVYQF